MFPNGMDASTLLSQDECLTPDIDEVMAVNIFWKRPQNGQFFMNAQKSDLKFHVFFIFQGASF